MRLGDTVRSEFVKASSLRVPVYTAAVTAVVVIALSWGLTFMADRAIAEGRPDDVAGLEPTSAFLVLLHYGQIGVILFGCWLMFEEQERGNLRTSLLATPGRVQLFAAKALTTAAGSFVIAVVTVLGSYAVRSVIVRGVSVTETALGDVRVIAGYIGYWTLLGVLAFALSAAVRNAIIGLGILLMTVLALSAYLRTVTPLARFLPDQAGAQMYQEMPPVGEDFGPVLGSIVLIAWVLIALLAGAFSFQRWSVS